MGSGANEQTLEQRITALLRQNGKMQVSDLCNALALRGVVFTEKDVTDAVWKLTRSDQIAMYESSTAAKSLWNTLKNWEGNLGIYGSLLICLIAVATVYFLPSLGYVRLIVGSCYLLYVPGYLLTKALFPDPRKLRGLERILLSFALSSCLAIFDGVLLNYAWSLTINSVVMSTSAITIILGVVAMLRSYQLPLTPKTPTLNSNR